MAGFVERVVSLIGITPTLKAQPSRTKMTEGEININFYQNEEISAEMEQVILSDIERMADIPE